MSSWSATLRAVVCLSVLPLSASKKGAMMKRSLSPVVIWAMLGCLSVGLAQLPTHNDPQQTQWVNLGGQLVPAGTVDLTYEYEEIWDYVPNVEGCECKVPAYAVEMKARHTRVLLALPWVQPTPSADDKGVLGRSHGWPAGKKLEYDDKTFEPDVPPQKLFGYQITNPEAEGPKVKVVLAGGNHPHEHMGCWVLEGMVNFLAGGDPRAVGLRDKAVFFVYPMVNPDGRVFHLHGVPRYTYARFAASPEMYAAGVPNHNRVWNTTGRFRNIDIVTAAMKKDTGGRADYAWDFHGGCPHNRIDRPISRHVGAFA